MQKISWLLLLSVFCSLSLSAQRLTTDDLYAVYGDSDYMKSIIKMDLVSKSDFETQKKDASNYINKSKAKSYKKGNILTLPLTNGGEATYTDHKTDDITYQEYEYFGQIDFLDVYMIEYVYSESSGFMFISKADGSEIESFEEYPFISKDKRYIVTIKPDAYEHTAQIAIYKIENKRISLITIDNFEKWTPLYEEQIFWSGRDNSLYIPALHIDLHKLTKDMSNHSQYIRLSILE